MSTSFAGNSGLPRGLRDNNPGNIRPNPKYKWFGEIGQEHGYSIFIDVEHGLRAMAKDLKSKIKRGLNTIESYVKIYAPPEDGNNTEGYIQRIVTSTGIARNAILTPDAATLFKLVKAHVAVEIGDHYSGYITDQMITEGVAMANPV